jgi:hypothetical protein
MPVQGGRVSGEAETGSDSRQLWPDMLRQKWLDSRKELVA